MIKMTTHIYGFSLLLFSEYKRVNRSRIGGAKSVTMSSNVCILTKKVSRSNSSETIVVFLLSQHNLAVFLFVCDIQHWNLDNEVKSWPVHEIYRTLLCGNLV